MNLQTETAPKIQEELVEKGTHEKYPEEMAELRENPYKLQMDKTGYPKQRETPACTSYLKHGMKLRRSRRKLIGLVAEV